MRDGVTLWVDALLVAALGGWIGIGALENIREPRLNADMVADVLAMRTMRREYPDQFALVGGNRVEDPGFHRFAFGAIVVGEGVATLLLIAGALDLAAAAFGLCDAGDGAAGRGRRDARLHDGLVCFSGWRPVVSLLARGTGRAAHPFPAGDLGRRDADWGDARVSQPSSRLREKVDARRG